jgi:hypothetical protein
MGSVIPKTEYNFAHASFKDDREALDLFFGPIESGNPNDQIDFFDDNDTMAHIVHRIGMFKSVNDARRNGWDKPVPRGYSEHKFKKRGLRMFVLGPF